MTQSPLSLRCDFVLAKLSLSIDDSAERVDDLFAAIQAIRDYAASLYHETSGAVTVPTLLAADEVTRAAFMDGLRDADMWECLASFEDQLLGY